MLTLEDDNDIVSMMGNMKLSESNSDDRGKRSTCDLNTVGQPLGLEEFKNDQDFRESAPSTKLKHLFDELDKLKKKCSNESREKCVIVSQWTSMLDVVKYHLNILGYRYHMIDGRVKPEERMKLVTDFNENPHGAEIMLLSLVAGGVGLNLIGGNHLFLLDNHWNPALEQQATDRIYRIGQEKDVVIHKFVCEGTIEEKIQEIQKAKRNLAASLLEGTNRVGTKLSVQELRKIFNV